MYYLRYSSIKKIKQSVTTPYVTYISHEITNLMTHNYVIISASFIYFLIYLLFFPKFRLIFKNHMVLKKTKCECFPRRVFFFSGRQFISYQLLVLYQEIDILASIE